MKRKTTIPPELEGEFTIRVMELPLTSPGFVMYDEDDHANVYLNSRYNQETNENTADHEITHIENDDLHNDDPIDVIEARADGIPAPLRSIPNLVRARDLVKKQTVTTPQEVGSNAQAPSAKPTISPHQAAVLFNAISDLDAWLFSDNRYDF